MATLATPANMTKFKRPDKKIKRPQGDITIFGARPMAYSPETGEEYSADAGDYWNRPADEPLLDSRGEPMILVFKRVVYIDAEEYDG